jgi:quinol monooxygenase YgiN
MEQGSGIYGLVVRFELLDDHEGAFDALTAETVALIRIKEPGTLVYVVHRELGAPAVRVFYELYRDEAAFETHEAQPHVARFLAERGQHLRSDPEVWRVEPLGGVVRAEADPGSV